jgi:hypothetical protein
MTEVGRVLGGAVLGLALGALVAGGASADEGGGARGAGGFRDGGLRLGSFYGAPGFSGYSGFGSVNGGDRLSRYGRPLSPFPCPYPTLYVVPTGGAGSR